jgi:hypothetical protein
MRRLMPLYFLMAHPASGWQHANGDEAKWTVADNALTVKPGTGAIQTKQKFGDCQLHIEWRIDKNVKGDGQGPW